jgi:hypothetical protein
MAATTIPGMVVAIAEAAATAEVAAMAEVAVAMVAEATSAECA